jgi:hypothetical protein
VPTSFAPRTERPFRACHLATADAERRTGETAYRRSRVRSALALGAVLSVFLAGVAGPAVARTASPEPSSEEVVRPQAAGGTAFRVQLESDCAGDGGCQFDFGKKAKVRTVTAVTCLLQLVDDAVGVVGTVRIGDGAGFDYFIPVASTARFGSGQGATFVQFEDFDVPARERLSIVLFPAGEAENAVCSVTGQFR